MASRPPACSHSCVTVTLTLRTWVPCTECRENSSRLAREIATASSTFISVPGAGPMWNVRSPIRALTPPLRKSEMVIPGRCTASVVRSCSSCASVQCRMSPGRSRTCRKSPCSTTSSSPNAGVRSRNRAPLTFDSNFSSAWRTGLGGTDNSGCIAARLSDHVRRPRIHVNATSANLKGIIILN